MKIVIVSISFLFFFLHNHKKNILCRYHQTVKTLIILWAPSISLAWVDTPLLRSSHTFHTPINTFHLHVDSGDTRKAPLSWTRGGQTWHGRLWVDSQSFVLCFTYYCRCAFTGLQKRWPFPFSSMSSPTPSALAILPVLKSFTLMASNRRYLSLSNSFCSVKCVFRDCLTIQTEKKPSFPLLIWVNYLFFFVYMIK